MQIEGMEALEANAGDAARFMKALGNESRLLILCGLAGHGEMTVGALAETVGLSQSALSQHLALLRDDGLVTYRREAQSLHYRVADPRAMQVLSTLRQIYCR